MNRRNFLKLLGLSAAPVPALAQEAVHEGEVVLMMGHYDSHHIFVNGAKAEEKITYTSYNGYDLHKVTATSDDVITVKGAWCDVQASFKPKWDAEEGKFNSVYIHTIFEDEDDPNFQHLTKIVAKI